MPGEIIFEEDVEDSNEDEEIKQIDKIEDKIELMKTKLKEKTLKIITLKENLNQSKQLKK